MRVTSVSKRAESLGDAAASIYVISSESIRRAGVATVPEALRLAPNLQVARVDARNYAVTARGFNSPFENKLLVLIDGRSVYTPLFSGVFWDAQDVVLADVERIEVISGPGATLWGANAVNGVINIITKSAGATQGLLAGAGFDREMRSGVLRYGGALGGGGRYRVYAKALQGDDLPREGLATPSLTGWRRSQLGFRADWGSAEDLFTVQGDAYAGALHQQGTTDIRIGGANLLARKSQRLASGQELTAQVYLDHTERNQPLAFIEHLDTLDLQLQSAMTPFERHRLVVGAGYRVANDSLQNGAGFAFLPAEEKLHWGNVFVEDEIDLNDQLRLVAGVKFEHNNYTGTEFLPTLRLAYKPTGASLLWGARCARPRASTATCTAPANRRWWPACRNSPSAAVPASSPKWPRSPNWATASRPCRPCPCPPPPSSAGTSACAPWSRRPTGSDRCSPTSLRGATRVSRCGAPGKPAPPCGWTPGWWRSGSTRRSTPAAATPAAPPDWPPAIPAITGACAPRSTSRTATAST